MAHVLLEGKQVFAMRRSRGKKKSPEKQKRPYRFKYRDTRDPALIHELGQKGLALPTVTYSLREDGADLGKIEYWTTAALSVATGRTTRQIRQWAADGLFIPARRIQGQIVWTREDVQALLSTGEFPDQTIHSHGHEGDIAQRAADAKGESLADALRDLERDDDKAGREKQLPKPLPGLPGSR